MSTLRGRLVVVSALGSAVVVASLALLLRARADALTASDVVIYAAMAALAAAGVTALLATRALQPVTGLSTAFTGPTRDLAEQLGRIELPGELQPVVDRTRALLAEVAGALDREREFTGNVAHELRTPLTVLRTGLEIALRRTKGTEAHATLDELLTVVDEMTKLVSNLLTLARVERDADATKLEPVALRPLVEAVWRRLEKKALTRELAFDNLVPDDYLLQADAGKLHIVVQNLLSNAVSYTEAGGSIRVEASAERLLSVWDSGPQLDDEALDRVFDRLWRADAARTDATEHAGLGLSLARALGRHMKMELLAENVDDGGLRFVLTRAA